MEQEKNAKRKNETPAKRAFRDFYKRIFTKKWMQPIPDDTEWHYPEANPNSDLPSKTGSDIKSQSNLGPA